MFQCLKTYGFHICINKWTFHFCAQKFQHRCLFTVKDKIETEFVITMQCYYPKGNNKLFVLRNHTLKHCIAPRF